MKASHLFLTALFAGSVVAIPARAEDQPKDPVLQCEDEATEAGIPDQQFDAYVAQCVERLEQQSSEKSTGESGHKESDS